MNPVLATVLRILGIEAITRLGHRLPGVWPRVVSVAVLLVANLVPVLGVWQGWLGFGDVFALYWLENVVVWLTSTVRILTAGQGEAWGNVGLAGFFLLHYGIFTLVHGVFTAVLTVLAGGLTGHVLGFVLTLALLVISHLVNLAFFWFAHDGRRASTPGRAMLAPYPRMMVLHVSVIVSGFFLFGGLASGGAERADQFWPVLVLCGLKILVDLGGSLLADKVRTGSFTVTLNGRPVG